MIWNDLPQKPVTRAVQNFRKRLQACVFKAGGDWPFNVTDFMLMCFRTNFVFFIFRRQKTHFFYFSAFYLIGRKIRPHFRSFSFFGTKMAVKTKKKVILWLSQCTEGRTLSHLQLHTAAVYIATRRT